MNYYTSLIMLAVAIIIILLIIIVQNKNFDKHIRKGFIITCIFIIIGIVCEWGGTAIDGKKMDIVYNLNIKLHFVIKFAELTIVPIIPIVCSKTIFENLKEDTKLNNILFNISMVSIAVEEIFLIIGKIFVLDENNVYYHAELYNIYILSFIISIIYMFSNALRFSNYYQINNRIELYSILMFMIFGVAMQILNYNIKTCWITVSISATFIYIYYNGLIQWVDRLTVLLNQNSYNAYLENHENTKFALIIFDVNDFKLINDNLGHDFGDKILTAIAEVIKEEYNRYGRCYRIGGDEFAVIVEKNIENVEKMNIEFIKKLELRRRMILELPHVSYGYAVYKPNNKNQYKIDDVKREADSNMYKYKKRFKEKMRTK